MTDKTQMIKELARLQNILTETESQISDKYNTQDINDWLQSEADVLRHMISKINNYLTS